MCNCAAQDAYVALQDILSSLPRETLIWLRDTLEKEVSNERQTS